MTTFNTLVNSVKALVSPAPKAPAAKPPAAAPVKMATDSIKLTKRPADEYANNGMVQLQRAQIRMADAMGQSRETLGAAQAKADGADNFFDQVVAQAGLGGLARNNEKLHALGRLTGRLAANGTASNEDRLALATLVGQATRGQVSEAELGRLLVKAEDVVRNAGRTPASDRGLANATQALTARIGQLESAIGDLEGAMGQTQSAEEVQKVQMKLADLQQDRATLLAFKAQADRLANKRGATPDALHMMKAIVTQAAGAQAPQALLTQAEFVARNAGQPGDRALHQATLGLSTQIGDIDAAIGDLADHAQSTESTMELQKIQIKMADLSRDRDTLVALKGEADRVANGRDELDGGERGRLLHHLDAAANNPSPEDRLQILQELRTIGR